jgi:hypothetical protein
MSHLVVCAIEDPGVPNPLKQLTILGQNLRQVTNQLNVQQLQIFLKHSFQIKLLPVLGSKLSS